MQNADILTPGRLAEPSEIDEVDLVPVRTYWQLVRIRFLRHRLAVIALVTLSILIVASIVIPLVAGDGWKKSSLQLIDAGPTLTAPLGYNEIGQNMFVRLMKATQTTLIIGFMAVLIIGTLGSLVGSVAGYVGGRVDNLLMRMIDVILSLPFLFLILLIVSFFGIRDIRVIVIAIGIVGWTTAARLVRAEFLSIRETDYAQAARALGVQHRRLITLPLADDDGAVDIHVVEGRTHRLDRGVIGSMLVALAHPSARRQCCGLGDLEHLDDTGAAHSILPRIVRTSAYSEPRRRTATK